MNGGQDIKLIIHVSASLYMVILIYSNHQSQFQKSRVINPAIEPC